MNNVYYFDTLPVRFRPQGLESLTSYLIRLADYPLTSFENMASATGCSESQLLKTTFYHLGRKFRRSIAALRSDHFLLGSLVPCLRYCPACLSESSYYSLTWRFATLLGCAKHGCRFLEHCVRCRKEIPLFSTPLKMSKCPMCKMDLRTCRAESLNEEERKTAHFHVLDLEFLLSPHTCEKDDTLLKTVGQRLSRNRAPRIITAKMVARRVGIKPYQVYLVDQGSPRGRSANFQSYVKYAGLFGPPLRHLFSVEARRKY